jgi:hypothetical protein
VTQAGLSATSPHAIAQKPAQLRAFRSYPCRGLVLTIVLLLSSSAVAQVLTLDNMLAILERKSPMLLEYDSKVKALDEYSAGAKSWMTPMVGVGTFMTPYGKQNDNGRARQRRLDAFSRTGNS